MQIGSASGSGGRHNFGFHADVKKEDGTYSLPLSLTSTAGNDLANMLILSRNSLPFSTAPHCRNALVCLVIFLL
jgi:hypothetical protein